MIRAVCMSLLAVAVLAACATQPQVRVYSDDTADPGSFERFAFVSNPGTDTADYTSLVTRHLKEAVSTELEARGYRYVEQPDSADMLVNFYVNTRERTEVRDRPGLSFDHYYGYRRDRYSVWTGYSTRRDIRSYTEGTLHIDLVDRARKQLVWEGVATGRVTSAALDDPRTAINEAVAAIFARYPYTAAGTRAPADSDR